VLVQKGAKITKTVTLQDSVKAPVGAGDRMGVLTLMQNGTVIAEIPIVAQCDVPRLGYGALLSRILRYCCMKG